MGRQHRSGIGEDVGGSQRIALGERDVIPLERSTFNPWQPHAFPHPFDTEPTRIWVAVRRAAPLPVPQRLRRGAERPLAPTRTAAIP